MSNLNKYCLIVCLVFSFLMACDKNEIKQEPGISPVELLSPGDGSAIVLDPDQTDPVVFNWKSVKANDGTFVFYKILFDAASGDFSDPLMVIKSAQEGEATSASLFRPSLDLLAELAGAKPDEAVTLKWVVVADNGVESSQSERPFTFTLQVAEPSDGYILMMAADQLMDSIVVHFLKGMPLDIWGEYYPRRDTYWDGAATVWGQGAAFSAYTALKYMAENNEILKTKYKNQYDSRLLTSIDQFRNTKNGWKEAYAVFPGSGDERYYDDNIWIGLDMVDLFSLTNDTRYLDRAKLVWNFVMAGSNNLAGGGVHWKEEHAAKSKNTCSTAPATVLGLKMYGVTGEQAYLDQAREWYEWLKNTLQDPEDKLYWDSAKLEDPENPDSTIVIEKAKYTYNAGQPMQAAALLYEITGDEKYLRDAQEIATAAYNRWFVPFYSDVLGKEVRMWNDNNIWFNVILLRGYIELYQIDGNERFVNAYKDILLHAWFSNALNKKTGLLNTDFRGTTPQDEWKILYQGACVELLARLAELENSKLNN